MQADTFKAGVAPGGPITHSEVKTLLCYVLTELAVPLSFELLHEAMREHELINYFALVEALDQLADSGHVRHEGAENGEQLYSVTELGAGTAKELAASLPASVREKAVASASLAVRRQKRRAEVIIRETRSGGGFQLELLIPDEGGTLLELKVFAPSTEQRDLIKQRFLNDPVYLYQGVLSLLTGDDGILDGAEKESEKLF